MKRVTHLKQGRGLLSYQRSTDTNNRYSSRQLLLVGAEVSAGPVAWQLQPTKWESGLTTASPSPTSAPRSTTLEEETSSALMSAGTSTNTPAGNPEDTRMAWAAGPDGQDRPQTARRRRACLAFRLGQRGPAAARQLCRCRPMSGTDTLRTELRKKIRPESSGGGRTWAAAFVAAAAGGGGRRWSTRPSWDSRVP